MNFIRILITTVVVTVFAMVSTIPTVPYVKYDGIFSSAVTFDANIFDLTGEVSERLTDRTTDGKYGKVVHVDVHGMVTPDSVKSWAFEVAKAGPNDLLVLNIHSPGGYVSAGEQFIKVVEASPAKYKISYVHKAASMATHIMMSTDLLVGPKNAPILIHLGGVNGYFPFALDEHDRVPLSYIIYFTKHGQNAYYRNLCDFGERLLETQRDFIKTGKDLVVPLWMFIANDGMGLKKETVVEYCKMADVLEHEIKNLEEKNGY